jgi:hypothetical protein
MQRAKISEHCNFRALQQKPLRAHAATCARTRGAALRAKDMDLWGRKCQSPAIIAAKLARNRLHGCALIV